MTTKKKYSAETEAFIKLAESHRVHCEAKQQLVSAQLMELSNDS